MEIEAYAKVNLTLEVLGMRKDGYHDLRSVVAPVGVSDTVRIREAQTTSCRMAADGDASFKIDFSSMGADEDNLAVKALRVMQKASGISRECEIEIVKRIPLGGGLGGGSADAAAVIVSLDKMWDLGFGMERLAELGALVGSDVPALVCARLSGAMAMMEGRGERVRPFGARLPSPVWLVLANPGVFSSTPKVFKACGIVRDNGDMTISNRMELAVSSGEASSIALALNNDLSESAVALYPEIAAARSALLDAGALAAQVSGSGATVFGVARSREEAELIASRVSERGIGAVTARIL